MHYLELQTNLSASHAVQVTTVLWLVSGLLLICVMLATYVGEDLLYKIPLIKYMETGVQLVTSVHKVSPVLSLVLLEATCLMLEEEMLVIVYYVCPVTIV